MVKKKRSKIDYEDSSLVDPTSRSFIYDEVDDYNNIDQDEEYAELDNENTTKVISNNKRKEHVLGLDLDSSEDDDDKDDDNNETDDDDKDDISFDEDIESSENEDDVPLEDERTMGKKKKDYFGTDITDERMHNVVKMKKKKKKEEESLQVELDLAQQMQKRIGKEKEAFQFFMDDELEASEEKVKEAKQQKTKGGDLSSVKKLGKDKKSKKQLKESGLDPEVQEKCDELTILLSPLIGGLKKGLLPHSDATEYLTTRYLLCLNFLNNVAAKKMLERSGDDMCQHPVETRLAQYRQMYKELDNCKAAFEPELHKLLEDLSSGVLRKQNRKMLGILKEKKSEKDEKKMESEPNNIKDKKIEKEDISDEEEMDDDMEDVIKGDVEEVDAQGRRLITYEMEKNKGLMPSRKKEQRNPRVKYKKKYQNKLKRRKGQVREVRNEATRYGGEIFGIKSNVIKSIKLK